jgi:hypothetical protein
MVGSDDLRSSGSGRRHGTERDETVPEVTLTAGTGRYVLAMAGAELKEVAEFVVSPAKAIRRRRGSEPAHRTISALDPSMVLLNPIVEVLAGPVFHVVTQHCSNGAWITVVPVRGDPRRNHTGDGSVAKFWG